MSEQVRPRVLIADDEPDIRLMARMVLRRSGFVIDEVPSGQDAVDAIDGRDYEAVVLDQRMPGLTGIETARKLRGHGHCLPIIIFSAYLNEDVESEAAEMGLTTLSKSDIQKLSEVLHSLMEARPDVDGTDVRR